MSVVGMPGYQETPIGWLPISWAVSTFGSLLAEKPEYGANASAENFDDGYVRYVRITDIDDAGGLIPSNSKYLPPEAAKDYLLSDNDIVIARTGNTVGKSLRYRSHMGPCAFAGYLIRFRVGPSLSPEFTAQYVRSDAYWSWVKSSVKVGAQPNINSQQYQSLLLPVPPLPEQKKIAAILTAVDEKLDVIARQIEASQTLKQGLMQTLFSRGVGTQDADGRWVPHAEQKPSALGMVPSSWVVEPLDRYVSKVGSGVTPKGGSTSYQSSGIPLIRSQNVLVGRLSLDDVAYIDEVQHNKMRNSALEPEDVLLNITGASIGRCAVLPRDFSEGNVNQHVCIIRTLPSLNPQFLCQYINSSFGQKQVAKFQAGGNREGLNYQQVRSFDVPVPSVAEQEKIVDLLEAVDGKVRCLERKQLQHQTLKRGLMQKLLTGEWRVKVDAELTA